MAKLGSNNIVIYASFEEIRVKIWKIYIVYS